MTTPREMLQEALSAVTSGRAGYGTPEVNHARTAMFWSIYLGFPVSSRQVCVMNNLQKVARQMADPLHDDSYTDMAGYAANAVVASDDTEAAKEVLASLWEEEERGIARLEQEEADDQEDGDGEDFEPEEDSDEDLGSAAEEE